MINLLFRRNKKFQNINFTNKEVNNIEADYRWRSTNQIDNRRHSHIDDLEKAKIDNLKLPLFNEDSSSNKMFLNDYQINQIQEKNEEDEEVENFQDMELEEDVINLRKALTNTKYQKMRSFNVDHGRVVDCGFRSSKSKIFTSNVSSLF